MKHINELNDRAFKSMNMNNFYQPKAKTTLVSAFRSVNHSPKDILSVGVSWASKYLEQQGLSVTLWGEQRPNQKFDTVIAMDESLCQYADEQHQKTEIAKMTSTLTKNGMIFASIRDYRNGNFHKRPLGDTVINILDSQTLITVEVNQQDNQDKQRWRQHIYAIQDAVDFEIYDCGDYRTLYFKQLAKYCTDAGAAEYGVFKDIFWKGHWRRNPEHIVWARF